MAQPAVPPAPFELAPPAAESTGWLPPVHQAEGPANRLLAELAMALAADSDGDEAGKWSKGASLRFVFATCGAFWLMAAVAFYTLH